MAKKTTDTRITDTVDRKTPFDLDSVQDLFKSWANFNANLASIFIDAAEKSNEIASRTTHETISNLRDVTDVREDFADYGKAYGDFMQKQAELVMGSTQSLVDVSRKAGTETTDLASKAGEKLAEKTSANVNAAAEKASEKAA